MLHSNYLIATFLGRCNLLVLGILIAINFSIAFLTNHWLKMSGFQIGKYKHSLYILILVALLTYLYYVMGLNLAFFKNYALVILLYPCLLYDLKEKLIPVNFLLVFILPFFLINLFSFNVSSLIDIAVALVIFVFFTVVSKLSDTAIGEGDAYLIAAIVCLIGRKVAFSLTIAALALLAIFALFALLFKFVNKKDSLPFTPFYATAYLLFLIFFVL